MTVNIELTPAAEHHLREKAREANAAAVRLSVKESGCSGLEYVLECVDAPGDGDLRRAQEGFELFVDPDAYARALDGLTIDFQSDLLSSGLVYHNPNQKGECGCGASFTV